MNSELLAELAALAPAGCRLGLRRLDAADIPRLTAAEAALIPTAGPARRTEFATGRALLHELLPGSGPILTVASGAPSLPDGVVGSLAHDRVAALAVLAPATSAAALGIDLEHVRSDSDDDELRSAVLRADDTPLHPTLAFVIKEAAYKAYSGLGGPMVGPLDVRLTATGHTFVTHFPATAHTAAWSVEGVYVSSSDCWAALAAVPR